MPMDEQQPSVLDAYFIENRAKLIDLAAFMDRFQRIGGGANTTKDVRWIAIVRGVALLNDGKPDRACRLLELWSDPSSEPIETAGTKGALGTWPGLSSS